jgi:hypothetical protein
MRDVRARAIPNEVHLTIAGHGDRRVGDLIGRLTHEGCEPKHVELITGHSRAECVAAAYRVAVAASG